LAQYFAAPGARPRALNNTLFQRRISYSHEEP
jgi:hypothetical protein